MRTVRLLIVRTVREFNDDNCLHLAAGVAFYATLSLFPLVLGLIAVFSFILEPTAVQEQAIDVVAIYIPGSERYVADVIRGLIRARGPATVLGTAVLIFSSMQGFAAIRKSVNLAWDVDKDQPFLWSTLIDLLGAFLIGPLFVALSLLSALFSSFIDGILGIPQALLALSSSPLGEILPPDVVEAVAQSFVIDLFASIKTPVLYITIRWLLPFLSTFAIFALIYRLLPNIRVHWREVWPGALLAALLFGAVENVFLWYLHNWANYRIVYGPIEPMIIVLLWLYLSAIVLLLGAEFASEYGRLVGAEHGYENGAKS